MRKIICRILVLVLCCSFFLTGCAKKAQAPVASTPSGTTTPEVEVPVISNDKFNVPDSKTDYLVKDGKTEYIIVYPENPTTYETTAVEELTVLFYQGTGILLSAKKDNENIPSNTAFISIGKTKQLEKTDIEITSDELGYTGSKVKTIGRNVYIAGNTGMGSLFGVYEFLHYSIGYEFYADQVITFDKKSSYALKLFDITLIPDIDIGEFGWRKFRDYDTDAISNRYKSFNPSYTTVGHGMGHNTFWYLPKEIYFEDHPDWYAPDGQQLCFSNTEMVDEFAKNVIARFSTEPVDEKRLMIFIGQEDVFVWCSCPKCAASKKKYGTDSAVLIKFMNKLAEKIDAWIAENQPGREVVYMFFAYHCSLTPPVEMAPDGTIRPYDNDQSLILRDNVYPWIAHLASGWSDPIEEDDSFKYIIEGWDALANKICFYSYCFHSRQQYVNFDNLNSLQQNLQLLKEYDTFYFMDQGGLQEPDSPTFVAYRAYITYKLIWDVNANVQVLKENFFANYYDDASEWLMKYLDELLLLQRYNADKYDLIGSVGEEKTLAKYWPQAVLEKWLSYFEKAFEAIEKYKTTDIDYYNTLYKRVRLEQLSVLYLSIQLYGEQMFDVDTLLAHKKAVYADFWSYGCYPAEGVNAQALIQLGQSWGVA